MKKSTLALTLLSALVLFPGSFILSSESNALAAINEDIPVEDFTSVSIGIPATVYIEQSGSHSLTINADQDVLEKIEVKTIDGKLVIKPKKSVRTIKGDIEIYITAPEYNAISLAGSVKLLCEKKLQAEELDLKIAGSGKIEFADLNAEELDLKISGSGSIVLAGSGGEEFNVAISGSGKIDAQNYEVQEFEGKISGSGKCLIFVSGELEAQISGSGSIYYKGKPEVQTSISGSGKVRKL